MLAFPALRQMPPDISEAERLTWDLEKADGWDRYWRREKFIHIPLPFSVSVAKEYRARWENQGEQNANLYLLGLWEEFSRLKIDPGASDDDLACQAKRLAKLCHRALTQIHNLPALARHLLRFFNRYDIRPPTGITGLAGVSRGVTAHTEHIDSFSTLPRGIIARITTDSWWHRKLRVAHGRILESSAIRLGQVHQFAGRYVSDAGLRRFEHRQRTNERILASLIAENERGDTFELSNLIQRSLANPANRRNELMVRIHGFDQLAKGLGHAAVLLTVTCPSRMHAYLGKSGKPNPKYDGFHTPKEAQRYLAQIWARIRAALHRKGLKPYGFRITEPHHDGTPHWHVLLFDAPSELKQTVEIVRHYALADSPTETGAQLHRFKAEAIDPKKGSATAYVAKYISKNVDGHGLSTSDQEAPPASAAQRVRAWASTWGIRQFQQIGGPPIGLWREMRRAPELAKHDSLVGELATAADEGNWALFVNLLGGPKASRKELPIALAHYDDSRLGRFGEPLGLRVAGVRYANVVFSTRFHTWNIKRKEVEQNCTSPEAEAAPATHKSAATVDAPPPWSSVNNCTPGDIRHQKKHSSNR